MKLKKDKILCKKGFTVSVPKVELLICSVTKQPQN